MTTKKQFPALTDRQITETMRKKGGGFVSRLGQLYRFADDENQAKLKEVFAGYWCQYAAMTKQCPECGCTEIRNYHHEWETCGVPGKKPL